MPMGFYNIDSSNNARRVNLCEVCQSKDDQVAGGWVAHSVKIPDPRERVQHIFHKKCLLEKVMLARKCPTCQSQGEINGIFDNYPERLAFFRTEGNRANSMLQSCIRIDMVIAGSIFFLLFNMHFESNSILQSHAVKYLASSTSFLVAPCCLVAGYRINAKIKNKRLAFIQSALCSSIASGVCLAANQFFGSLDAGYFNSTSVFIWIASIVLLPKLFKFKSEEAVRRNPAQFRNPIPRAGQRAF